MAKKFKFNPRQARKQLRQGYREGVEQQLRFLPRQLREELSHRWGQDPRRIQEQQALQEKFAPTQYKQQLAGLEALAPGYMEKYKAMGDLALSSAKTPTAYENAVNADLSSGYHLPAGLASEVTNTIRGRQALTGNTEGNAPINAEAAFTGSAMNQMYQQRLQNAMQGTQVGNQRLGNLAAFLQGSNPIQQVQGIAPISPDRSFAYVNPNAGYLGEQGMQQQLQNQMGQFAANNSGQGGGFPWGQAIQAGGQVVQAAGAAGAFSDRRLKKDIHKVGETPTGLDIYRYTMKHSGKKFVGPMAQDVEKRQPEAVHTDPASGLKMVNFSKVR